MKEYQRPKRMFTVFLVENSTRKKKPSSSTLSVLSMRKTRSSSSKVESSSFDGEQIKSEISHDLDTEERKQLEIIWRKLVQDYQNVVENDDFGYNSNDEDDFSSFLPTMSSRSQSRVSKKSISF